MARYASSHGFANESRLGGFNPTRSTDFDTYILDQFLGGRSEIGHRRGLMSRVGLRPTVTVNVGVGDGPETVADGVAVILKVRRSGWVWDYRSASESM